MKIKRNRKRKKSIQEKALFFSFSILPLFSLIFLLFLLIFFLFFSSLGVLGGRLEAAKYGNFEDGLFYSFPLFFLFSGV